MSRRPVIAVALGAVIVAAFFMLRGNPSWLLFQFPASLMSEQAPEPDQQKSAAATPAPTQAKASVNAEIARAAAEIEGAPEFDIVRIDPNGGSVFAGRALPGSLVTILANEKPFATVKAGATGEWAVVTDNRMPAGDVKLSLTARANDAANPTRGKTMTVSVAAGTVASVAAPMQGQARLSAASGRDTAAAVGRMAAPATATSADTKIARNFEKLVASAGDAAAQRPVSIPVPITFVYREAAFTPDGQRAVGMLADYLLISRINDVKLSGHADERGTAVHNMELSRQRLEAVARQLHDRGYQGKVELLPKGETEPYRGVDRSKLSRDEVYQLDRRVELHLQ